MVIKLEDSEVRQALADALCKKVNYMVTDIDPQDCWFEACSEDVEMPDVSEVRFCHRASDS